MLYTEMVPTCSKLNVYIAFRPLQQISNKCKSYNQQNRESQVTFVQRITTTKFGSFFLFFQVSQFKVPMLQNYFFHSCFWINNDVNKRLKGRDCWKLKSSFYPPTAKLEICRMRSSDLQRGFPPSAVMGWGPGQSFSCRWGQWSQLLLLGTLSAFLDPVGRGVSSPIYPFFSTAHWEFPVKAEAGPLLHCIPWLSQSCWGCTSPPSSHDHLILSKSPLKTCVLCSGELRSVTPPLQRSLMTIIWLREPIGSIVGRINGGRACNTQQFITIVTLVVNWNY